MEGNKIKPMNPELVKKLLNRITVDLYGRPIEKVSESKCPGCGETTAASYSDGSQMRGSCGCDYLTKMVKANANYIIVTDSGHYGAQTLYIKGYKEAKEKYDEIIASGVSMDVITMAEVIKINK